MNPWLLALAPQIRVVTEHFQLAGQSLPASKALSKREFNLGRGTIRLNFHYGIGRITADSREFTAPNGTSEVVQAGLPPPGALISF